MRVSRASAVAGLTLSAIGALGGCGRDDLVPETSRTETETGLLTQRDAVRALVADLAVPLLPGSTVEDATGRWAGCGEDRDATTWPERSGFAEMSYAASATLLGPVDPETAEERGRSLLEDAGFTVGRVVPQPPSVQVFGSRDEVEASVALFVASDRITVAVRGACVPLPEHTRAEWSAKVDQQARIRLH